MPEENPCPGYLQIGRKQNILGKDGGEMATGVVQRAVGSGFRGCISEFPSPLTVRWESDFCTAVFEGRKEGEGLVARRIADEGKTRLRNSFRSAEKGRAGD